MHKPIMNCAITSRQFCGKVKRSMSPHCIAACNAANSTKSSIFIGINLALGTPPTWCPALPILCKAVAILPGDPICITKSTLPMSIPISREEEETTARNLPSFNRDSTSNLIFLSIDPWCPAIKFAKPNLSSSILFNSFCILFTTNSVILRVFANTMVVLCAKIKSKISKISYSKISLSDKL